MSSAPSGAALTQPNVATLVIRADGRNSSRVVLEHILHPGGCSSSAMT